MSNQKKILIIFDGPHLAYSPTTAQLYKELKKDFDVTIFARDPFKFSFKNNITLPYQLIIYKEPTRVVAYFYKILHLFVLLFAKKAKEIEKIFKNSSSDYFRRFLKIEKIIATKEFDKIICIDLKNLFFIN